MDRDKAKIILKESIEKAFDEDELENNREGCIGESTINLMAEAALSVLLATEEIQNFLNREGLMKED